jgi:hypothetical protein
MSEVKALYPIGKTQWAKWRAEQRIAFNETRAAGVPFADAVKYVNELELIEVNIAPKPEPKKKSGLLRALEDTIEGLNKVGEVAEAVVDVVEVAVPAVAVAKTVARATRGAPKKKAK